jgi:hypothetical protein
MDIPMPSPEDDDPRELLRLAELQATTGNKTLTPEQIESVVSRLQSEIDSIARSRLIKTLGYATHGDLAWVVERYLNGPDPEAAYAAIKVLCEYWKRTERYVDFVAAYIVEEPWDPYGLCQAAALTIAEEHLLEQAAQGKPLEKRLLHALADLYENQDQDINTRYYACWTLQRAMGIDLDNDACDDTVKRARE